MINDAYLIYLFSGLIGIIIGSFISMLTWRLPRILDLTPEEQLKNISVSRSHCPQCQTPLPWYRLFPLFSWLASRGKCHACKTPISARYPIIEFITGLFTLIIIQQFGLNITAAYALVFTWILITICVIDIEHQLILDKLSLPLMWIGLLINTQSTFTSPIEAIWGAAAGYMILWTIFQVFKLITGKEGMGFGDFKLLAALGAWFGIASLPQIILIASISSIILGVFLAVTRLKPLNEPIPFGPYLAIGGWVSLILGSDLIQHI